MRFRLFLLLILAGIAAYAVLWWRLADHAEDAAREMFDRLATRGIDAEAADISVGGFPYRIALSLSDLELRVPGAVPPLSMTASRAMLFTHPWTPDHYVAGTSTLSGRLGAWVLSMPQARASWLRDRDDSRVDVDIPNLALGTSDLDETPLVAERTQVHIRIPVAAVDEATGLLLPERADLALKFNRIDLADAAAGAPAGLIALAELRAEVHGRLAFPLTRAGLAAWRDEGGTLEIAALRIDWGPVRITGSGSLALDDAFRPLGALGLHVERPQPLIAYLAARGLIDRGAAEGARGLVRALMAKGGDEPVELSLSLQDGQLFLGVLPLARLGPVVRD